MNLRRLIVSSAGNDAERNALIAKIGKILDDAQRVNPLRPDIYLLRGHLDIGDTHIDATPWIIAAKAAYQHALALDQKSSEGCVALSIILARIGDLPGARKLSEQGMAYTYLEGLEVLQLPMDPADQDADRRYRWRIAACCARNRSGREDHAAPEIGADG